MVVNAGKCSVDSLSDASAPIYIGMVYSLTASVSRYHVVRGQLAGDFKETEHFKLRIQVKKKGGGEKPS